MRVWPKNEQHLFKELEIFFQPTPTIKTHSYDYSRESNDYLKETKVSEFWSISQKLVISKISGKLDSRNLILTKIQNF